MDDADAVLADLCDFSADEIATLRSFGAISRPASCTVLLAPRHFTRIGLLDHVRLTCLVEMLTTR